MEARLLAMQAAELAPNLESPWLVLAAAAEPAESIQYLKRALEINPASQRARKGLAWALQRQRTANLAGIAENMADVTAPVDSYREPLPGEDTDRIPVLPYRMQEPPSGDADEEITDRIRVFSRPPEPPITTVTKPLPPPAATPKPAKAPPRSGKKPAHPKAVKPPPGKKPAKKPRSDQASRVGCILIASLPWLIAVAVLCIGVTLWVGFATHFIVLAEDMGSPINLLYSPTPSRTPTQPPTHTFTPTTTPTPTSSITPSPKPSHTSTPLPTFTPLPTDTEVPPPVATEIPVIEITPVTYEAGLPPSYYGAGAGHWIDVDLTNQRLYAYDGDQVISSFLVSTGTWLHPTVTGQYSIYIKLLYDDMAGPGYYLPDVPYTMYFYKGYAIHGTYWHNNFGVPMSHGCINLSIADAGWVYNFSSVGTLVNIHY